MTVHSVVRAWSVVLAMVAAVLIAALPALAVDRLFLKDGRVLEGQVIRDVNGNIFFRYRIGGIEQSQMFTVEQIEKLERDAGAAPAGPRDPARPASSAPAPAARGGDRHNDGVTRGAIITLGEGGDKNMVGLFMTAETLRRAIPVLEEEGVDVVVFRIQSGGGALLEVQRLSDVIHNEFKPKFRVVAWIQSAISAAAMTAHCIEEIYFTSQGNYGAATGWFGALQAVTGRDLEEILYMMERISARGGYDPKIMRSMQVDDALSATINADGTVSWYQDETSGEHVVNPQGRILTFNAIQAEKFKFSKGTANTLNELASLMGYNELVWVGETRPGWLWPVSRGEEMQIRFRNKTFEDQQRVNEYRGLYDQAIQAAQGEQDRQRRAAMVGRARKSLDQLRSMVKNNPNFKLFNFNMTDEQFEAWLAEQERLLRQLLR